MSSPERDFEPAICRVCSCTEAAPCERRCCWVPDPGDGDLCSACLVTVYESVGRLLLGRADPVDRAILARFAQIELPDDDPPPARVLLLPCVSAVPCALPVAA